VFLEQSEEAVLAGVFHNDVISFGLGNLFVVHEKAFASLEPFKKFDLHVVKEQELSLQEAVATYFFNSQLVEKETGKIDLIATKQCENHPKIQKILQKLPIEQVHYVDLNESMRNGGGPACLKISFPITHQELQLINPKFLLTDQLERALKEWIEYYYEDCLQWPDLKNPHFLKKNQEAFFELSKFFR
jgi:succinylarginine dihydrolase